MNLKKLSFAYATAVICINADNNIKAMTYNNIIIENVINSGKYSTESEGNMSKELKKIKEVYKDLGFTNTTVISIAFDIVKSYYKHEPITISKTGDNELLLYTIVNGEYRNIIIENSGDVEFLCVPLNRRETYNEHYSFSLIDVENLANKL